MRSAASVIIRSVAASLRGNASRLSGESVSTRWPVIPTLNANGRRGGPPRAGDAFAASSKDDSLFNLLVRRSPVLVIPDRVERIEMRLIVTIDEVQRKFVLGDAAVLVLDRELLPVARYLDFLSREYRIHRRA